MKKTHLLTLLAMLMCIPAFAQEADFELAFRKSIGANVLYAARDVKYTATTTQEADIKIYMNDELIGEATATELKSTFNINTPGTYIATAKATRNGVTLSKSVKVVYAGESQPAADKTVPPMGVTKNSDGSYTFCFAAPLKQNVMVMGSWNGYEPDLINTMQYIDTKEDGNDIRYFKVTIPGTVTGNTFGYYYHVDGAKSVGDPYARLVLDPYNDKYISAEVYPDMPEYPKDLVPTNTLVAWYSDNLLNYDWKTTGFSAPAKDNLVIYEMLFRDFTGTEGAAKGNGTVRKAMEKIDYIKSLGVNAVELLPINEFNGNNSWGYNPNFYFAIDKAYGTPQDYKAFIDLCHENGIAVILDVVFNQSDGLHPWYQLYPIASNPFYNQTAPHAYSVLNDWKQEYPLVQTQWHDMLKFWLSEYKVDGFRFDLVKGLGNNDSYANNYDSGTNAYNASRVARMKKLHDAMREVNPYAYFINENLAGAKEENEMAADGELNWANVNYAGCEYAMGWLTNSNLNRMWAKKDSRTAGSTVAYLESHDEERLAYKQDMWGATGVVGDVKVSMQRLGSAAAQMILVPGSHMIWMFSEMGNAQSTKSENGNNTSPKIVNWALLDEPNHAGLKDCYSELIAIRLNNNSLFAEDSNYTLNFSQNSKCRTASSTNEDKEIYLVVNPTINQTLTQEVKFLSDDNNNYYVASKSYESNPIFDAAAKAVTIEPNCYAVFGSKSLLMEGGLSKVENDATHIYGVYGGIRIDDAAGDAEVYALDGSKVAKAHKADLNEGGVISLPAGIYVVRCSGKSAKVMVR